MAMIIDHHDENGNDTRGSVGGSDTTEYCRVSPTTTYSLDFHARQLFDYAAQRWVNGVKKGRFDQS